VDESVTLPNAFQALEEFARTWALPTSDERLYRRMNGSMAEIQAFYNAVLPVTEQALSFLDQYDLGGMPPDALRLYYLLLASAEVALAVEVYRAPRLPLAPSQSRFKVTHHHMGD